MLSSLDGLGLNIIVKDVLHGLGEAKENTNMTIGKDTIGALGTRG